MSSYFDEMGRRVAEAEQAKDSEKVQKLLNEVKQRVANYLVWIEAHALKSELGKVTVLKEKYKVIVDRGARYGASFLVSGDLHELGHDIGRARIKTRGGGYCGDSPYWPGHYGVG